MSHSVVKLRAKMQLLHGHFPGLRASCIYATGSRTVCRTLIPDLGYKALLIGIKLQDQGSKLKSRRKVL